MKIYREVKCSERLPEFKKAGQILFFFNKANRGTIGFMQNEYEVATDYNETEDLRKMKCWLEPIEVTLDSEEILPVEERGKMLTYIHSDNCDDLDITINYLEKYHKALEAAELQVAKFKKQNTELMMRNFELESDNGLSMIKADERYQKAWKYINEFRGCDVIESKYCEVDSLEETLKLAAYGKIE